MCEAAPPAPPACRPTRLPSTGRLLATLLVVSCCQSSAFAQLMCDPSPVVSNRLPFPQPPFAWPPLLPTPLPAGQPGFLPQVGFLSLYLEVAARALLLTSLCVTLLLLCQTAFPSPPLPPPRTPLSPTPPSPQPQPPFHAGQPGFRPQVLDMLAVSCWLSSTPDCQQFAVTDLVLILHAEC